MQPSFWANRGQIIFFNFFYPDACTFKKNCDICITKSVTNGHRKHTRGVSSAGSEHLPYKQGVTGSNPVRPTRKKPYDANRKAFFLQKCYALKLVVYFNMNQLSHPDTGARPGFDEAYP